MLHRQISILSSIAVAFALTGCSSAPANEGAVAQSESAISGCQDDCDTSDSEDAHAPVITLHLDGYLVNTDDGTATILGTSETGNDMAITVTSSTRVKRTPIGQWPVDPYRPIAVAWNALIQSGQHAFGSASVEEGSSFSSFMLEFTNGTKHARVKVDSAGTALTLRPLP
jgi:hypothetical protein